MLENAPFKLGTVYLKTKTFSKNQDSNPEQCMNEDHASLR
jgi:hypothetical protein